MGKSKSHPCKHPVEAQRESNQKDHDAGIFWCHKCKQRITFSTMKPVLRDEVPVIMEGSPSGV
jgi:hypothetical protein